MHIHAYTCTYMHIHAYTCTYMHIHAHTCFIHAHTCIYIHIHAHTYHSLHIKALDSPQSVWHHMCAIESLSLPLICGFVASIGWRPLRALPVKEFSRLVIQQSVSSAKNLDLLRVSILGGILGRQMQTVLGAVAELAGLSIVAAIGVCLRLVREECSQEDGSSAPNTVRPLKDFSIFRQCVPSFQKGSKALMSNGNAPAGGPLRAIFSA